MLAVVFTLCLLRVSSAYELKCSERNVTSATMRPAEDGIVGRYTTQVCVEKKPNVIEWGLDLTFKADKYCINKHHGFHPGKPHSMFKGNVTNRMEELNCTYVCLETQWDLIFSSCYLLKSTLRKNNIEFPPYDSHFNITNPYTLQYFNVTAEVSIITHEHEKDVVDVVVSFYGRQPPTEFSVDLYNKNKSLPHQVVTENCSIAADSILVECSVRVEFGCYVLWLKHLAPWSFGVLDSLASVKAEWCPSAPRRLGAVETAGASGASAAAWWCATAAACAAAAALLWRARDHRHWHKRVLRYWEHLRSAAERTDDEAVAAVETGEADEADEACVLLLYARECESGERLVARLRELLQQHYNVQVTDLFSAESMRQAGAAAHAWVRGALRRRRVLLLQTPALLALHNPLQPLSTRAPLLHARAPAARVYRAPHYGDALLQYALRLLSDDACQPHAYRKYYLATLSAVPTEVFPSVVPFQRYPLPEAAALLARDLAPAAHAAHSEPAADAHGCTEPAADALRRLEVSALEFATYVRDHPDYLDELLIT